MKPRIRFDKFIWICKSAGAIGFGKTPEHAFKDWEAHDKRRRAEYA